MGLDYSSGGGNTGGSQPGMEKFFFMNLLHPNGRVRVYLLHLGTMRSCFGRKRRSLWIGGIWKMDSSIA
jgi:hypothetical protein